MACKGLFHFRAASTRPTTARVVGGSTYCPEAERPPVARLHLAVCWVIASLAPLAMKVGSSPATPATSGHLIHQLRRDGRNGPSGGAVIDQGPLYSPSLDLVERFADVEASPVVPSRAAT